MTVITNKTSFLLMLMTLFFMMSWSFLAPQKACPWSSVDLGDQIMNTHQSMCRAAYEALQNDPALRFDPSYPGPVFPSLDAILNYVDGPDDEKAGAPFSAHVYNSFLDGTNKGSGPKYVKLHYDRLAMAMVKLYGGDKLNPVDSAGAAKDAAWMAHFIQDLTNIYHLLGMPAADFSKRRIGSQVLGDYPLSPAEDDTTVLIKRFIEHQHKQPDIVDWFDPYYYDGKGSTLKNQIDASTHMLFEGYLLSGSIPVPAKKALFWSIPTTDVEGFAGGVAGFLRGDFTRGNREFLSPASNSTKFLIAFGTQCTYKLWRASFCGLRFGYMELTRLPGTHTYRVKVRVKNFADNDAKNVTIKYTLIEGGKSKDFVPGSAIASLGVGSEADAPSVDIPILNPDALLTVSLKTDFDDDKYSATHDSRQMLRVYRLEDLVGKADAAYTAASLDLTKKANRASIIAGEEVTYIYRVKNTGGVPLTRVKVEDDKCLLMDPAGADLAPDQEQEFRCSMQIFEDMPNTAVAKGFDPDGIEVPSKEAKFKVTIGAPGKVIVPHVLRMTLESAEYKIAEAGLSMGTPQYRFDDSIPEGEVIEQSPAPGLLVDLGSLVSVTISRGKQRKAERIMLTPPFVTATVGKSVSFIADVVFSDGDVKQWTGLVTWSPGPRNVFTCKEPGKFIVEAQVGDAYGAATVTCEEDWSVPAFTPPITSSGDGGRVPQAAPSDYKWYAFCNPRNGEVTYGEQLPTGQSIMAGPFAGPRTVQDWIASNCPRWRCDSSGVCATAPAPGRGGLWKVLCGKQDGTIYVGTTHDDSKHILVQQGFLGEPDARAWASSVYPNWQCTADGAPKVAPTTPRIGGNWAVVCSRKHGGVGLTRSPDYIDYFVWRDGLLGEPDARLWTDQNCPSWRCDSEGRCLSGVARREPDGRPLEVPSEGPPPEPTQEQRSGSGSDSKSYETGRKIGEALGKLVLGAAGAAAGGTQPTEPAKPAGKKPTASSKPPSTTKPGGTTSKYPAGAYSGEWDAPRGTIRDPSGKQAARNCDGVLMGGPIKMTVKADGTVDGELYNYTQSYIYRIKGRVDSSGQLNATAECYLYRESICWKEVTSCTLRGAMKPGASGPTGSGTISCGPNTGTSYCTGSWGR